MTPTRRPIKPASPARQGTLPLYRQLMDQLTRRIETGLLPPGGRAPSEAELCAEFGVSSTTARRCLNDLATQGLLERQQGRGTFVRRTPEVPARLRVGMLYHDLIDLADGFCAAAMRGAAQMQAQAGVDPALIHLGQIRDAASPAEALDTLARQQGIAGLFLLSPTPLDWLAKLLDRGLPVSSLNFAYDDKRISATRMDTSPARRELACRLHALGHRHILEIQGRFDPALTQGITPYPAPPITPEHETSPTPWVTDSCDYFRPDQLRELILRHLAKPRRPTALVCRGYDLALATQATLEELQWRVPQEMTLCFIGAAPPGADIHGYHVPITELAAIASADLLHRMTGQAFDAPNPAALRCQEVQGITLGPASPLSASI